MPGVVEGNLGRAQRLRARPWQEPKSKRGGMETARGRIGRGLPRSRRPPAAPGPRPRRRRRRRARGRGHRLLRHRPQGRSGDPQGRGKQGAGPARLRGTAHRVELHLGFLAPALETLVARDGGHGARDRRRRGRGPSRRGAAGGGHRPRPLRSLARPPSPPRSGSSGRGARKRPRSPPPPRSRTRRAGTTAPTRGSWCSRTRTASWAPIARPAVALSVVPVAQRDGSMERDYWYTNGPRPGRPPGAGGSGTHRRRAHAAPPGRAEGADLRGPRRLRSRDGGRAPGHALPRASPATPSSATRPS